MNRIATAVLVLLGATALVASASATPVVDRALALAVHADVTTKGANGATSSLTFDRGRVTALTDTSITLKRADNVDVTLARTSSTNVRAANRLAVGRAVLVVSTGGTATRIVTGATLGLLPGAGRVANGVHSDVVVKLRNGSTRTLAVDRGRVTSRSATSLTITRADGQAVTLTLAENARVHFGLRGVRSIERLRPNAAVVVVSEGGKALSIQASARAFVRP